MSWQQTLSLVAVVSFTAVAAACLAGTAATAVLVAAWRSRWAQNRPLVRYVLVSIYLHVLLVIFASSISLLPGTQPVASRRLSVEILDAPWELESDRFLPVETSTDVVVAQSDSGLSPSAGLQERSINEGALEPADAQVDANSDSLTRNDGALPSQPAQPVASELHVGPPLADAQSQQAPEPHPAAIEAPNDSSLKAESPKSPTANGDLDRADSLSPSLPTKTGELIGDSQEVPTVSPPTREQFKPKPELSPGAESRLSDSSKFQEQISGSTFETNAGQPVLLKEQSTSESNSWTVVAADRAWGRPADGKALPVLYRGRYEPLKSELVRRYGGDQNTEGAVHRALAWLARVQRPDGRWRARDHGAGLEQRVHGQDRQHAGIDADTGITGLALLALLGAGQTHFEGEYRRHVESGLEFLLRTQTPDGDLSGGAGTFAAMYCHGIALLAVAEAHALTGDARLRPAMEKAQQYTLRAQSRVDGGWRYRPGDAEGDTSQLGWQLLALKSAELSGLPIPSTCQQGVEHFLRRVSLGQFGALASYRAGMAPSRAMTAEALVCRYFLGQQLPDGALDEVAAYLMREPPGTGPTNLYYWYYATLGLYLTQHPAWHDWNRHLVRQLLTLQTSAGPYAGSWPSDTVWGGYGGRVYATAMATLCLEVYYRYQPRAHMASFQEVRRPTGLLSR